MASGTWNTGTWGLNQWGDNANADVSVTGANDISWGNGAYGSGNYGGLDNPLSISTGSVTVNAEINAGWGRLSWGNLAWGDAYSVQLNGISLTSAIGEETTSADANTDINGNLLNLLIDPVTITTDVGFDVTGIFLSTNIGQATFNKLDATNLQMSTGIGTVDIAAGGNITVNPIEDQLDAFVGQVTETIEVGPIVDGIVATLSINGVTAQADADVEVTNSAPLFQFTTEGNAQLSTAQAKFGTASLLLDGTDDYIETTTNLDLSSSDFTIDLWIRPDNVTGYKGIWQSGTSTTEQSYLLGSTVYWTVNPSTIITTAVTVNANEWTMLSYERQGNTHRIYKNGTLEDTATTANKQDNGTFSIGKNGFGDFDGYIDEVRVSDIPRYTGSSFTEPTSEFEFDSNTNVLIHLDGANGSTDIKSADDTSFPGVISEGQVTAIPGVLVDVTGIAMTMAMGEEDAVTDVDVSVTGQSMTMAIDSVDAVSIAEVTGQQLSANIGSVTNTADANVNLTGILMTSSIGTPAITAWQEIDPGASNVWTEVDLAA